MMLFDVRYVNPKYVAEHPAEFVFTDAVPTVHGHWIASDSGTISGICSNCNWHAHYGEDDVAGFPYCPNCGAKMDEENVMKKTKRVG